MTSPDDLADVRERVRARYADAAATVLTGGTPTCGEPCTDGETGHIAGALSFTEYTDGLAQAGFAAITITPTHEIADGMHSAIIRAARP
jgi:hypothetical protein